MCDIYPVSRIDSFFFPVLNCYTSLSITVLFQWLSLHETDYFRHCGHTVVGAVGPRLPWFQCILSRNFVIFQIFLRFRFQIRNPSLLMFLLLKNSTNCDRAPPYLDTFPKISYFENSGQEKLSDKKGPEPGVNSGRTTATTGKVQNTCRTARHYTVESSRICIFMRNCGRRSFVAHSSRGVQHW